MQTEVGQNLNLVKDVILSKIIFRASFLIYVFIYSEKC